MTFRLTKLYIIQCHIPISNQTIIHLPSYTLPNDIFLEEQLRAYICYFSPFQTVNSK